MMVKHGFRGFLFIVCINKDVRSSDKRGVWQLFLYKLPLRGIRRFRHCFRRFGQQTNKKVTVTVKTVTKTAKTATRTANPLGVGVAAGMLVHEGHKAWCHTAQHQKGFAPHSSAPGANHP
jgi:hypothetical protein